MNLKGNRILVSQETPVEQTASGIYIPQTLQKPRNIGKIIAVGDTADQSFLGKDVMFHIQSAQDFEHENVKGKLIFVTDIIATL